MNETRTEPEQAGAPGRIYVDAYLAFWPGPKEGTVEYVLAAPADALATMLVEYKEITDMPLMESEHNETCPCLQCRSDRALTHYRETTRGGEV